MHYLYHTDPGPVSNLTGRSNLTSVLLTWAPPENPNGIIVTYEITYKVNGRNRKVNTTDTSIFISGLKPNTTISDISVRAYTSVGQGEVKNLTTLTTQSISGKAVY